MSTIKAFSDRLSAAQKAADLTALQTLCRALDEDDGGVFWKATRAEITKKFAKRSKDFISLRTLIELQSLRTHFKFLTARAARMQLEKRVAALEAQLAELQQSQSQ